ncbi:Cytochrome c556 [Oceanospirillum multiglobuliferum]|uniref:Cytochrome C n=1 Tax=Oceanospirillum multiglobuliferum TaxID=64969 RepID=A0A1T4R2Y4_9GAMM|nr:cytochrome c [Oceanospirillum multiglobuliferum]OPX55287.1 hypothetical protein BTE48_10175 [Oceanospirillum multiglobuliferum]SKA10246.1 Cytochrome c556 [Oceanospirillum multiglobuliferum]
MKTLMLITLAWVFSTTSYAADYSDPAQAMKARQDQFEEIKTTFKQLRFDVMQKNFDAAATAKSAQKVAELSQPLLEMFRVRSDQGKTKALDRIWDNWPRFEKQMLEFVELNNKTVEALRYGNQDDAKDFVDQAAKSCKSCHRLFKAK